MKGKSSGAGAIFLILIVVVIVATCVLLAVSIRTDTVAESLKLGEDDKDNAKILSVLFVVEDDAGELIFSNLMMYYPQTGRAALVNIPANTGAIFQSLNRGGQTGRVDSIDAVYRERGIEVFSGEVGRLLQGEAIPFTVVISRQNLSRLADLLGGLRLFVSEPVDVSAENGERYLLPSGILLLDGDKVSSYLSYKLESESSEAVYERYQNLMAALVIAIKDKSGVLFSRKVFRRFADCLSVNLDSEAAYSLFKFIAGVNAEYIIRQNVAGTVRVVDSKTLLFPLNNGDFAKQAVMQIKNMITSASGTFGGRVYVLEVQNGTAVTGLARNTQILFQNAGYEVIAAKNAENSDYAKTTIIDHIGNLDAARMVGNFIRCENIVEEESGNLDADKDFTIILGQDFDGRYVRAR